MLKVLFVKKGLQELGSNRIYIDNLSKWFNECGVEVGINDNKYRDYDICILGKDCSFADLKEIKQSNSELLCGIVHPTDLNSDGLNKLKSASFCIVGSIEERDHYLKYNSNLFRFPQIERISCQRKKHSDKNIVKLGYHGNLSHLENSSKALKCALERLHKELRIELIVVYNRRLGKWRRGRPAISVRIIDWEFDKMLSEMSDVDIGIVPCTNNSFLDRHYSDCNYLGRMIKKFNGYANDYNLQFKANSNAGRAFVFHQLGIPVVADFWPSNFEICADPRCGRLAHSEDGWYHAIKELAVSAELRQNIADSAHGQFIVKYDPKEWAIRLINSIKNLSREAVVRKNDNINV